jgi:hypothetical protein
MLKRRLPLRFMSCIITPASRGFPDRELDLLATREELLFNYVPVLCDWSLRGQCGCRIGRISPRRSLVLCGLFGGLPFGLTLRDESTLSAVANVAGARDHLLAHSEVLAHALPSVLCLDQSRWLEGVGWVYWPMEFTRSGSPRLDWNGGRGFYFKDLKGHILGCGATSVETTLPRRRGTPPHEPTIGRTVSCWRSLV